MTVRDGKKSFFTQWMQFVYRPRQEMVDKYTASEEWGMGAQVVTNGLQEIATTPLESWCREGELNPHEG
jgi:hypothetical protein